MRQCKYHSWDYGRDLSAMRMSMGMTLGYMQAACKTGTVDPEAQHKTQPHLRRPCRMVCRWGCGMAGLLGRAFVLLPCESSHNGGCTNRPKSGPWLRPDTIPPAGEPLKCGDDIILCHWPC